MLFNADAGLFEPLRLAPALLVGFGYDLAVALWWCLPLVLLGWFWPALRARRALGVVALLLSAALLAGLIFVSVSEFVFWNEFASRFNFIAVDYPVYTREVVGNIRESYALADVRRHRRGDIGAGRALLARPLHRTAAREAPGFGRRSVLALAYVGGAVAVTAGVSTGWKDSLGQPQLAGGRQRRVEFFHALRYNQIDYQRFYATLPQAKVEAILHKRFGHAARYRLTPAPDMPIRREVLPTGARRDLNVVMVSIESLGAEFIETWAAPRPDAAPRTARPRGPVLHADVRHRHAHGARTGGADPSVPPTPGHATPMRPNNSGLFTLGGVLEAQGWDPLYIYGGYSYFDNMASFFGGNGYTVIDRRAIDKQDIHHENIWGVADEDPVRPGAARDRRARRRQTRIRARDDHLQPSPLHLPGGPHRHPLGQRPRRRG